MLPHDYVERTYAGVLGKIIGVYLGRPFEGWTYDHIMAELGEINYYVHEKRHVPLVVTDDDISGTFTFLRSLPDHGGSRNLTARQIGETWLNYIIEKKTILWWGGLGNSTEHTAYIRLKNGIPAPQSGSIAVNGKVVAEQIGAQIFIDGWAMVAPGDPQLAADFAARAGSVSHDGEAVYGAQVIAAMEAQAYVESDINRLLDTAVRFIPKDCLIYRLIGDVRNWHAQNSDWHATRSQIQANYGYDKYGGNVHMVPNHALIIMALLHGGDDFQKSLMIVNTSGWDTDCNSGNVGCVLGIKNGLAGIENGPDWRGPVADRMYLPTADGGRAITDAVAETYHIVNIGRALADEEPIRPKQGARFHFELPGSLQGFHIDDSVESRDVLTLENIAGHSLHGQRSLALRYQHLTTGRAARASTLTFIPPEDLKSMHYSLIASPTLYPGQTVRATLIADQGNAAPITARLYIRVYGSNDELTHCYGPEASLKPGVDHDFTWQIGDMDGAPIADIGVELTSAQRADGCVYLDRLTWDGSPDVVLRRPADNSTLWKRAWVEGVDRMDTYWIGSEYVRLIQDSGRGLISQGTADWQDYRTSATVTPHMVTAGGLAVRVQGLRRYYGLLLRKNGSKTTANLVKMADSEQVLASADFAWDFGTPYALSLQALGNRMQAWIGDRLLFDVEDKSNPLVGGGVGLVCEEGRMASGPVEVHPARSA